MSLTPLTNIQSWLSPRIFEKIRNNPNWILRGLGTLIYEKNLKSKILCQTPFKTCVDIVCTRPSLPILKYSSSLALIVWTSLLQLVTPTFDFTCGHNIHHVISIPRARAHAGTFSPSHRQQTTGHSPVPHYAPLVRLPTTAAVFHRRFTSNIRHTPGQENMVADALRCPPASQGPPADTQPRRDLIRKARSHPQG